MYLESVFSRKALLAVAAWERLYGEMDPLVAFQVVVSVEALRALVAFEWTVVLRCLRLVVVHVLQGAVATVEWWDHAGHPVDHGHLAVGLMDVGHDGA